MFNKRPIDQKWVDLADEIAESAAINLDSFVVMIAAQEGGKLGMALADNGHDGPELQAMHECFKVSISDGLRRLADAIDLNERTEPFEIQFAPGAFDAFDGTQEELQELLATIHKEFESGSPLMPFKHERVTPEDAELVARRIAEAMERRKKPQ
jgi:hypothetical protein